MYAAGSGLPIGFHRFTQGIPKQASNGIQWNNLLDYISLYSDDIAFKGDINSQTHRR